MTRESVVVGGRRYLLDAEGSFVRTNRGVTTKIRIEGDVQNVTVTIPLRITATRVVTCSGVSTLPACKGTYAGVRVATVEARAELRRVRTAAASFARSLQRALSRADELDTLLRDELNTHITKRPCPRSVLPRGHRSRIY